MATKKYTSRPKLLHRFSQKQLTGMIVTLGVSVLGVWTLLFSSAATPVGVDFVLFCPPAGQTCNGSSTKLNGYATIVRNWYATQLGGGRTFKIHAVKVHYALHATSYYSDQGTIAGETTYTLPRVAADLGIVISSDTSIKTAVIMGFRAITSECGRSYIPGSISLSDPSTSACNPPSAPAIYNVVVAHELGHMFGLQHVTTNDLMNHTYCKDASGYTVPLSSCTLSSAERSYLLTNYGAWFPAPTTTTTTPPTAGPDRLVLGQSLYAGQKITSQTGGYQAIFQSDGNFVVYNSAHAAIWASHSNGKGGYRAAFHSDGNLDVITSGGTQLWASNTSGHGGSRVVMQSDGNLVIYTSSNVALWSSKSGRTY